MDWVLQWWREILATLGALASLIGLPIAIVQIGRSRDAAVAAKDAADKTRGAIVHNLTAVDLERASNMIQGIRDLHRRREWDVALSQYHDLRRILADIKVRYPNLTAGQQTLIRVAIAQVQTIDERVSESRQMERIPEAESRDEEALLNVQSMLDDLASELKQKVQFQLGGN